MPFLQRLVLATLGAVLAAPAPAQDQGRPKERDAAAPPPKAAGKAADKRFDGPWQVRIACADTAGAKGYTYSFPAQVADSVLTGRRRMPKEDGFAEITGRIGADGAATLQVNGLTSDPDYSVGRAKRTSPFSYTVRANFNATSGTGKRLELRPCDLTFTRL